MRSLVDAHDIRDAPDTISSGTVRFSRDMIEADTWSLVCGGALHVQRRSLHFKSRSGNSSHLRQQMSPTRFTSSK